MHKSSGNDDKKLQSALKRIGVSTIPGIEEVNIFKEEEVVSFSNPKGEENAPTKRRIERSKQATNNKTSVQGEIGCHVPRLMRTDGIGIEMETRNGTRSGSRQTVSPPSRKLTRSHPDTRTVRQSKHPSLPTPSW